MIDEKKLTRYIKTEINPYGKPFDGTVFEFGNMLIDYMERMEKEPERKWIPVSERLPEEYETVIGVTDLNYYCIAVYCKQHGFRSMDVGVESDIIAWQPLPEPYKESVEK